MSRPVNIRKLTSRKSSDMLLKINEIIECLQRLKPIAGEGVSINDTTRGQVISATGSCPRTRQSRRGGGVDTGGDLRYS